MQNHPRHRPQQDDFARRDAPDDAPWEARDQRPHERSSWSEGDGGRTAEAFRNQGRDHDRDPSGGWGYGQNQQSRYGQGASAGWTDERGPAGPYGPGGYQPPSQYGPSSSYGAGPRFGQDYGLTGHEQQRGPMDQGYGQGYGASSHDQGRNHHSYGDQGYGRQAEMQRGYATHGYAPGGQIWEGSGRGMGGQTHEHHDFEPDYLHWRQQQLSAFDKDYSDWRSERREKFSADFDSWRQSRPRVQAENPIVGDVSDGGVGDASEAKKR